MKSKVEQRATEKSVTKDTAWERETSFAEGRNSLKDNSVLLGSNYRVCD
jgi:hypothetical protein